MSGQDFWGGLAQLITHPIAMLSYSLFIRYCPKSREPLTELLNWSARFWVPQMLGGGPRHSLLLAVANTLTALKNLIRMVTPSFFT